MMKKLLLLTSALCIFSFAGMSQTKQLSPDTIIVDTLHYYFNKYHFKTGTTLQNFPYYKSPAATQTAVTHCGSRFENWDTLIITGLEAFLAKHPKSTTLNVPVRLYLCTLDVNKMPKLPAIDSVIVNGQTMGPLLVSSTVQAMVGGPLAHGPVKLTTDFAVLFRNVSTIAGDTLRLLRTAGKTFTSTAPVSEKNSDSYGYIRYAGNFSATTNYSTTQGFGMGTDYEFCVAPRVIYPLHAGHTKPDAVNNEEQICAFTPLVFTNNSSKRYSHRMYNLNEFCTIWNLYSPFLAAPQAPGGWSGDSAITWKFESEDAIDGRVFLGYGGRAQNGTSGAFNTITFATDSMNPDSSCFSDNEFRARLRPMSIYGRVPQIAYDEDFKLCIIYCNGTELGTKENAADRIKLYPNPALNGRTTITGLNGKAFVEVHNMLGQRVLSAQTDQSVTHLDLSQQPAGAYFISVSDQSGSRMVKLIKQD